MRVALRAGRTIRSARAGVNGRVRQCHAAMVPKPAYPPVSREVELRWLWMTTLRRLTTGLVGEQRADRERVELLPSGDREDHALEAALRASRPRASTCAGVSACVASWNAFGSAGNAKSVGLRSSTARRRVGPGLAVHQDAAVRGRRVDIGGDRTAACRSRPGGRPALERGPGGGIGRVGRVDVHAERVTDDLLLEAARVDRRRWPSGRRRSSRSRRLARAMPRPPSPSANSSRSWIWSSLSFAVRSGFMREDRARRPGLSGVGLRKTTIPSP